MTLTPEMTPLRTPRGCFGQDMSCNSHIKHISRMSFFNTHTGTSFLRVMQENCSMHVLLTGCTVEIPYQDVSLFRN